MPTIIIRADDSHGDRGTATLVERAIPVDLHNQHYVERLIERVAWALQDAEKLESRVNGGASGVVERRDRAHPQRRGRRSATTA
jgi:hypothetical protein